MKSKILAFFFLVIFSQFICGLAFQLNEETHTTHKNGNSIDRKDGVKRDVYVSSKANKGKGSYGGQNNRPPNTKENKAVSMIVTKPACISYMGMSVILMCMMLVFDF
uniref:uncharacterized protein LOC122608502 n=1 Tax=Erigeron canadensis TaxID=72917 RepID=UPI001CB8CA3C|nr:uncharacterized protein LOC122608502 [Erigeron canadensis]